MKYLKAFEDFDAGMDGGVAGTYASLDNTTGMGPVEGTEVGIGILPWGFQSLPSKKKNKRRKKNHRESNK